MPKWFAVVEKTTSRPVSFGTRIAEPAQLAARGLEAIDLGEHPDAGPDFRNVYWDPTTRKLALLQLIDRLDDLLTDDQFAALRTAWATMTPAQKTAIRDALITLLGRARYRHPLDPIAVE